ncbi:LPXTG-motif cell wall anchor domain protein [Acidothermus cellulolyticus 11B]|uniref:LPXTG-motif cell wall anchor domain protein n=1 Tax=Acidothermus cellulolyticus (strain ATCC 43068 / DSM 8971 / 11B) TaxID=351607 RepID=A0LTF9_ACIC1|nr:cell wall anchor domain-containing protein [Acidothermus cellulolyticus]ABK52719.1 LPXTG-motif cell wall anchor domain protein [Acidothermus cellulolyticus 11B]
MIRTLRRAGVAAVLAAIAPLAVTAPATAASSDTGLFGSADPTYDGVYRQGLAVLGLIAAGQHPDAAAIDWLLGQQCADGAFTAYRPDPTVPCQTSKEDSNATALAAMALIAAGKTAAGTAAAHALANFQLADGGFYASAAFGTPASDANSTGLALSTFAAAGIDPTSITKNGKNGIDFLRSIQVPCTAGSGAGAFDYQPETPLAANDYATVQAVLGLLGKALPVPAATPAAAVPACVPSTDAATAAADAIGYLANRLTATHGAIPSAFGSGTDWTTTANALLDLIAAGQGAAAVQEGLAALQTNARSYITSNGTTSPGAVGTLLLVAAATGTNPRNFGGVDLVAALLATERSAPATATPTPSASASATPRPTATPATLPMTGSRVDLPVAAAGVVLLALGTALVLSARRPRRSRS